MLGPVIAELGTDRLLFGSDFPRLDHEADALGELLARRDELGESVPGPRDRPRLEIWQGRHGLEHH